MNPGAFFSLIYGDQSGWVPVATFRGGRYRAGEPLSQATWFEWPVQRDELLAHVAIHSGDDLYITPVLYKTSENRTALNSKTGQMVYADADSAPVASFRLEPTLTVQSSPGRHHLYWLIEDCTDPATLSQLSRNVAYSHAKDGCDLGGWDVGQLLRVPGSTNNKSSLSMPFKVRGEASGLIYTMNDFLGIYPPIIIERSTPDEPMPDDLPSYEEAAIYIADRPDIRRAVSTPMPYSSEGSNRSARMWWLLSEMSRIGIAKRDAFTIARQAGCNKYAQDGRPEEELWTELLKAYADEANQPPSTLEEMDAQAIIRQQQKAELSVPERAIKGVVQGPTLSFLRPGEHMLVPDDTFVDEFVAWGQTKTDGAPQYMRAAALSVLSAVYGDFGKPATRFDSGGLNLWFMVLGGTTRSRKSTIRGMMVDLLRDLRVEEQYNYLIGSDATSEALMSELADRDGRSSVFHRDEVHGLLYETGAKSYMAGFKEALTELYDGRVRARLRASGTTRKTEEARTSLVLYFAGVTDHVTRALTVADFASGFLARFVYIVAVPPERTRESEWMHQIEEDGPALHHRDDIRDKMLHDLRESRDNWAKLITPGEPQPIRYEADAWQRFNEFIIESGDFAEAHELHEILLPTMDRMTKAVLKVCILLAMHEGKQVVQIQHVLKGVQLAQEWAGYTVEIASKIRQSFWQQRQNDIEGHLEAMGGSSSWAKLYAKVRKDLRPKEFAEVMEALKSAGIAEIRLQNGTQIISKIG